MRLVYRSINSFSLNFTKLDPAVTQTGAKNYKIQSNNLIEGYFTKNHNAKPKMHTVVMIHEWWGFNKSITQTAQIFSNPNIRVFVPDLYRGEAANSAQVNVNYMQQAGHKMSSLNWPQALQDLKNVNSHFKDNSQSVSIVGFCMGGALTFAALASFQGWKAGGAFYGMPDFNIFRLDKITANVIAHFGALDPLQGFSDLKSAQKLKLDCQKNNYPINVQIYQNASHAFCNQSSLYFNESSRNTAFQLTRQLIEQ